MGRGRPHYDVNMIKKVCEAEKIDPSVFTIINNDNELASIAQAVLMVREGQGDILMKGLCSTDKYMRGILNKEKGLLPPKAVLSHVCVLDNPNYTSSSFSVTWPSSLFLTSIRRSPS